MSLFARVVEAGSISAAADQLDLSKSVVSQHLKLLEQELGVLLLKRTTRRQYLTEAGETFYEHCHELNQVAETAWTEIQNHTGVLSGRVRVTAPDALMAPLIAPLVGQLMEQYPGLRPELITSDQQLDLMQEQIDLAIRVGDSPSSQLKQRRIGQFRDVLCIAAELAGREPESLPYIANSWQGNRIEHHLKDAQGVEITLSYQPTGRVNSVQLCRTLLEVGAGVGILPDFVFHDCQRQAKLVELLPGTQLPEVPVYGVHTFQSSPPPVVKLLTDQISALLA